MTVQTTPTERIEHRIILLESVLSAKPMEFILNPKIILVVYGSMAIDKKRFSFIRPWLYRKLTGHLDNSGKVVIVCDGVKDQLNRVSKWAQFKSVEGEPYTFSSFAGSVQLLQQIRDSQVKHVHWELGDHADNSVQAESAVRKKAIPIEEVFQDCGDDVSHLAMDDDPQSMFENTYGDAEISSSDSEAGLFEGNFVQHYLAGSPDKSQTVSHADFQQLYAYLQTVPFSKKRTDFIEIFGGEGGVTRLGLRRQLACGRNYDLSCQVDLSDPAEVSSLWAYVRKYKPRCIVMAPPCTAFGAWSSYNKTHAPEAWQQSYRLGRPLAKLAAELAAWQLSQGLHFICENPWLSKLWELPEWRVLLQDSRIRWAYADQCAFGLTDADGHPTMKPTCFVCSCEELAAPLRRVCSKQHTHSQLAGSLHGESKTKFAQTWPIGLCKAVIQGIINVLRRTVQQYPADVAVAEVCRACKMHARRDDIRHVRDATCKYPNDIGVDWACPACKRHLHGYSPKHTKELGVCQWADAQTRVNSRGWTPKDPRVPAVDPPPEAAMDADDAEEGPPDTSVGNWTPLADLRLIDLFEELRTQEGWHQTDYGPLSVAFDAPFIRTPEPRLDQASYPRRSVFGWFPDLPNQFGNWWQVQDNAPSHRRSNIGYPVQVLVHLFHRADDPLPVKIKPDVLADNAGNGAAAPNSAAIQPFVPAVPREAGDVEVIPDELAIRPDDEEAQVTIVPDWTSFNLGKSLRALRSTSVPMVVRQLRVLHLRWWHAKADKMRGLLEAAGLPKSVLDHIHGVVDSCRVCRLWQSRGRSAVTSSRMSIEFNETVQVDLVFIASLVILHMICEATRWTMATIVAGKKCEDLLPAMIQGWFRIFGPPATLVADHEGSLCSEEASIAFERWGVAFKPKPVNSHAWVVERHNALLRDQFNHIRAQCLLEKLQVTDMEVLAEAVYAKNVMLQIKGRSPYQAVIGRTPAILQEFEQQGISAITDGDGGSLSRHAIRLRELALGSMIEGTAQDRLRRAAKSSTRAAGELIDLKVGESIDIWRTPATKDSVGWRGPATVMGTSNLESGYIDAKWGGRAMSVRIADARRSIVYISLMDSDIPELKYIIDYVLSLSACEMTLSVVQGPKGWVLSRTAQEHPNVFRAGLFVGANVFHIRCVGIRCGTGISSLRGLFSMNKCVLLWYNRNEPSDYRTMTHNGAVNISLKVIFGLDWELQNWIQFLGVDEEHADQVRLVAPDEPMLAQPPDDNGLLPPPRLEPIPEDAIMDDPDINMDDPPDPPQQPPPQPPQQPSRQRTTSPPPRNNPRQVHAQRHKQRPPPKPLPPSRERTPVPTDNSTIRSSTARTPVNTDESIHSQTSASTLPDGWRREHRQPGLEPKRRSQPPARGNTAASSSWETSAASGAAPLHVPLLPVHTDTEDEDDISTLNPSEVEFYGNHRKQVPVEGIDSTTSMMHIIRSQETYLASAVISDGPQDSEVDTEDCHEVEFSYVMARLLVDCPPMEPSDVLVYATSKKTGKTKRMVEKAFDILTAKEIRENWKECEIAFRKEVASYKDNKTYKITLRQLIENICSSKWVVKWKSTPEGRIIKARLTIRGFEDMQSNLSTYSSTASRWGQRIVCSICVQRKWLMFTADITTAFLQGLTFADLAALGDTTIRSVAFVPPVGSEIYFQELESSYVPWRDVLELLKPAYGLKDAPKAWRTRLIQVLESTGGRALHTDPNLFVWHKTGILTALLSSHVDDLKGGGIPEQVQIIKKALTKAFGSLKVNERVFEHCGIKHEQSLDNSKVRLHQNHYVAQLKLMELSGINTKDNALLTEAQIADYLSLLGGLSWTVQTRMDVAVYVCALQRAAKAPRAEHAVRLNQVTKWVKRKVAYLSYNTLPTPCCTIVISDSAFRKEDIRGLAMRGAIIGISTAQEETPSGQLHVIEFYSRKQRRVTRSTFSAELNGFADALDFGKLLAMTMTEILNHLPEASRLIQMEERGELTLPLRGVVDARSVYDALVAADIRPPSEISLIMMLCQIKEMMRTGVLRRLFWVDTKDMVADGLNKGACSRSALLDLGATGIWNISFKPIGFTESVHQPIRSVLESVTAAEHD